MRHWYDRISLQKKILYSELFLFIISFLVLVVFAVLDYRQVRQTELSYMRQYNQQLSLNLDTILSSTDSLKYFYLSDNKLRILLLENESDVDPEGFSEAEGQMKEKLSLLADIGGYVLRVNIVTQDGRRYENLVENQEAYYQKMQKIAEQISWQEKGQCYFTQRRKEIVGQVEYDVISMIYQLWDVNQQSPVGTMYLDLDFGKISNQLYQLKDGAADGEEFLIINEEGILFDSGQQEVAEQERLYAQIREIARTDKEGKLQLYGQRCIVIAMQNPTTGWYLVQSIPFAYLVEKILDNMWIVLVLILAALLVTVSGSYFFAKQVSYPVQILSGVMEEVAADGEEEKAIPLLEDFDQLWEDEIGAMVRSYNAMARRINNNIIQTYQYQLNQKQTELRMLQHQINPHFLYNALNTISAIARLQDVEHIPEISDSLSEMFRYNIKGKNVVTIREELKQLENYMVIQKLRFPKRFEVRYEISEELLDCPIIKFVLQPIVENSFRYGFVQKKEKDILDIQAVAEGEDVILSVRDNGVGIAQEQLAHMNRGLETNWDVLQEEQGIGLKNVNYRLRNYYGEGYGIWLESEQGVYTVVRLRIKREEGGM